MSQITVSCPSGHRLRGDTKMAGRKVKCPKCASVFIFSPPPRSAVTDTGVMQILGDVSALPPPPEAPSPATRACPHCDQRIPISANVCEHCHWYVGELPRYMQQIVRKTPPAEH